MNINDYDVNNPDFKYFYDSFKIKDPYLPETKLLPLCQALFQKQREVEDALKTVATWYRHDPFGCASKRVFNKLKEDDYRGNPEFEYYYDLIKNERPGYDDDETLYDSWISYHQQKTMEEAEKK